MGAAETILYDVATFVTALFLLESGADRFINHTVILSRRLGISETLVALVTAGAEWEELVVVISSLVQGRPSLAIGNIIGSAISNILGAFSLGLIFGQDGKAAEFDNSSRFYATLTLVVTTAITPISHLTKKTTSYAFGGSMIAIFAVYIISIGLAISRGTLSAPEDSDSDSDSNSGTSSVDRTPRETDALLAQSQPSALPATAPHHLRRRLIYHISQLVFGFLSMSLAGFVLSHAAINLADTTGVSESTFGIVFLAIATTLPEKFIAVMSGRRGYFGILTANTAGSNIFLLSLCLGIVLVAAPADFHNGNVKILELAVLWASTLGFTLTVWFGGKFGRWIGCLLLLAYLAFVVAEFTVIH